MKEELKISALYKKAYNDADLLINYKPEVLKDIEIPQNEPDEYSRGFQDRVKIYERELNMQMEFNFEELKEKYGNNLRQNPSKDLGKGIEKE